MAVYIIADNEVTDPETYREYAQRTSATVAQYGGKFLARGGQVETLEGGWKPGRFVILEFPSVERARAWYDGPEYSALKAMRRRASHSRLVLVHGAEH
ncbi:MAG TPA: DUF1330 domain-containing protein [Ktedonobacteraceae bacterium]|jgi:uncharacterized protein (DUF1330 family)|nr:DUF1330 domain-containing protein [Ktedonobacteraceae bacterium]